jgi:hypothetical protein
VLTWEIRVESEPIYVWSPLPIVTESSSRHRRLNVDFRVRRLGRVSGRAAMQQKQSHESAFGVCFLVA